MKTINNIKKIIGCSYKNGFGCILRVKHKDTEFIGIIYQNKELSFFDQWGNCFGIFKIKNENNFLDFFTRDVLSFWLFLENVKVVELINIFEIPNSKIDVMKKLADKLLKHK